MTFQSSYAKLLADPHFGEIKYRERHARQMYLDGMKHAASLCDTELMTEVDCECMNRIEEAIAEESK